MTTDLKKPLRSEWAPNHTRFVDG